MVHLSAPLFMQRPVWGFNKRYKNGRAPFRTDIMREIPPVERTPLRCRNFVKGSKNPPKDVVCIKEMLTLFNCMKLNDYSEKDCPNELAAFKSCYGKFLLDEKERSSIQDPTEPIPGQRRLTHRQLNVLLSKYPQRIDI